jgi:hypothetical protein
VIYHAGPPPYYCFESLPGVRHGVFTRLGGRSAGAFASLNVGHTVGDDAAHVEANHAAIYAALGLDPARVVCGRQVHGHQVAVVAASDGGRALAATDALVTDDPRLALMLRFADCAPVLFAAPRVGAVGIAHAGWRGAVARVAAHTVLAMVEAFGCRAEEILASVGPCIGPCCYEVGPEVVAQVEAAFGGAAQGMISRRRADGAAYLDLWEANTQQLREVGVERIERAALCTRCRRDLFFSHRGDGGRTGRFGVVISSGALG